MDSNILSKQSNGKTERKEKVLYGHSYREREGKVPFDVTGSAAGKSLDFPYLPESHIHLLPDSLLHSTDQQNNPLETLYYNVYMVDIICGNLQIAFLGGDTLHLQGHWKLHALSR